MSDLEPGEELLAAIDEAEIIDVIPDALGDPVKVGVLQGAVLIGVEGSPGILDTRESRDRFARAWMEACRVADGERPAAEAKPDLADEAKPDLADVLLMAAEADIVMREPDDEITDAASAAQAARDAREAWNDPEEAPDGQ